jgi:hypothetical protein
MACIVRRQWTEEGQGGETLLPCNLRSVPRELSGPVRPGTGGEGGREKSRASECRSKLPYLPYQISTWISNADSSKARLLAARQWQLAASCSGRPV